jgi:glycosyltransferase involved in cell wall biosynthesis
MPTPSPLLTVVIPTYNRPQLLPRAIDTALLAAPDGEVEVIVVPNGPDTSWKAIAEIYRTERRVLWHPIPVAHANAARNHGMRHACGKYIRFLDDDDYLLSDAAIQLTEARKADAEICGGNIIIISKNSGRERIQEIPSATDMIDMILLPKRATGLQFYIYLMESISNFSFDESVDIGQDTHWTHTLCRQKEWRFCHVRLNVCAWVQHSSEQLSLKYNASRHLKLQVEMLWETILTLEKAARLTGCRQNYAAKGMWDLVHAGFFLSPIYWSIILVRMRERFPETYPDIGLYRTQVGRKFNPLLVEILMLPKRWINYSVRWLLVKTGIRSFW